MKHRSLVSDKMPTNLGRVLLEALVPCGGTMLTKSASGAGPRTGRLWTAAVGR